MSLSDHFSSEYHELTEKLMDYFGLEYDVVSRDYGFRDFMLAKGHISACQGRYVFRDDGRDYHHEYWWWCRDRIKRMNGLPLYPED